MGTRRRPTGSRRSTPRAHEGSTAQRHAFRPLLRRIPRGTHQRPRSCHAQDDQALPPSFNERGDCRVTPRGPHHARRAPRRPRRVHRARALAI